MTSELDLLRTILDLVSKMQIQGGAGATLSTNFTNLQQSFPSNLPQQQF
jgi:hypothetical protein